MLKLNNSITVQYIDFNGLSELLNGSLSPDCLRNIFVENAGFKCDWSGVKLSLIYKYSNSQSGILRIKANIMKTDGMDEEASVASERANHLLLVSTALKEIDLSQLRLVDDLSQVDG